jgi:hypothetical protein
MRREIAVRAAKCWIPAASLLMAAVTAAHGQAPPRAAADTKTYTSKSWRWSVSYPSAWTVDAADPDQVRLRATGGNASCSIMSGPMDRFNNVDELTDFMLANDVQFFREKGHKLALVERRRITLPGRVAANDVLVDIGPGVRSRRGYVLADGRGFAVDCEASPGNWRSVEADYQRVIASFTVRK